MSVKRTEGRTVSERPFSPDALPVELYLKIGFRDPMEASRWCKQALESIRRVTFGHEMHFERIVIWGPPEPERGVVLTGYGYVFVSELTLRVLRALRDIAIPAAEPVSLSQLEYDLKMYAGSEADEHAYREIRAT